MRVLFWSANFWPNLGGLERISQELVLALNRRGVEFLVVAPDYPGRPDHDRWQGIPIRRFAFSDSDWFYRPDRVLELKQAVSRLKRDWSADLVHVSGLAESLLIHQLTSRSACPMLVTLHGEIPAPGSTTSSLFEEVLTQAAGVGCCSRWTEQELLAVLPECRSRSRVVLNALPLADSRPVRGRLPKLLCAGRLAPEKELEVALLGFVQSGFAGVLDFAGDGPQQPVLQELARELGVADRVRFLGRLSESELHREMSQSLALLVPSRSEGFGLVALEAAWHGCPVVASRVGGLPEVVRHGRTGWLARRGHASDFARAIERLVRRPGATLRMGREARRWARSRFCWDRFVDGYEQWYRELLAR